MERPPRASARCPRSAFPERCRDRPAVCAATRDGVVADAPPDLSILVSVGFLPTATYKRLKAGKGPPGLKAFSDPGPFGPERALHSFSRLCVAIGGRPSPGLLCSGSLSPPGTRLPRSRLSRLHLFFLRITTPSRVRGSLSLWRTPLSHAPSALSVGVGAGRSPSPAWSLPRGLPTARSRVCSAGSFRTPRALSFGRVLASEAAHRRNPGPRPGGT